MTTSKNIDGVQEITLIAPLKRGVVPCSGETLSYASRLRLFLSALFEQRKTGLETAREEGGMLERLQILDFVRWAIIDDDTKLMLGVSFDGPWEPYIRRIVEKAGPILDAIFCHCSDYAGSSCYDGYPKFSAWVREHQIEIPFIHVDNPDLSVDDVRYLKEFELRHARGVDAPFALDPVRYPESRRPLGRVFALFALRAYFVQTVDPRSTLDDQEYFDRVAHAILEPDFGLLGSLFQVLSVSPARDVRTAATLAWAANLIQQPRPAHAPREGMPEELTAHREIQGNILSSYSGKVTHGAVALLRFKGKAEGAAFLRRIEPSLTFEGDEHPIKLNLALTFEGLRTLGLQKHELALFPREFQEGLEQRAALLGDIGLNHPERWSLPEANWPLDGANGEPIRLSLVDAILNVQTSDEAAESHELLPALAGFLVSVVEADGAQLEILHVQPTRRYHDAKGVVLGHVGAVDGVSQPVARGRDRGPFAPSDVVDVGELLLGYKNRSGESGTLPTPLQLNSTFMALRKMSQDPEVYRSLSSEHFERALGRKPNGDNLIDHSNSNAFTYSDDKSGAKCPFFSHVRRSNPRQEDTPRILRRGMTYGPKYERPDQQKRGVMFMVFAPNLAEQYEIVQKWVNGGNSTGVFSGHPDLIAGTHPVDSRRLLQYPDGPNSSTLPVPKNPASVLEWGLYGFVPSRSALRVLGDDDRAPFPSIGPREAEPLPSTAPQYGAAPLSKDGDAMKARLEDIYRPPMIEATLNAVLGDSGEGRAPDYATIMGHPQLVAQALTTPAKYSVRNYWARMRECDATLYLGMDPEPKMLVDPSEPFIQDVKPGRYKDESELPNQFIREIKFAPAFAAAHQAATDWFEEQTTGHEHLAGFAQQLEPRLADALGEPPTLNLVAMSSRVIRDVASKLYGLPKELLSDDEPLDWPAGAAPVNPETAVRCPVDLTNVFAHVFPPRPNRAASELAHESGKRIKERISAWYQDKKNAEAAAQSPLIAEARNAPHQTPDFVERTIIGLLSGFAVPTYGSMLGVLSQLVASDELWRWQRRVPAGAPDEALQTELTERIYELMINTPVPAMITRTPLFEDALRKPPEVVALHLGAAAKIAQKNGVPEPWKFLFGDVPSTIGNSSDATHRCPGQQMALGVIVGTVYALLEQKRLKKVALNPLALTKYD